MHLHLQTGNQKLRKDEIYGTFFQRYVGSFVKVATNGGKRAATRTFQIPKGLLEVSIPIYHAASVYRTGAAELLHGLTR